MLNRVFSVAAAITISLTTVAPAEAMTISSAARSVASALPVQSAAVGFSERAAFSRQLLCLEYADACGAERIRTISYTSKLRTVLASVNRSVNREMPDIRARREFLSLTAMSSSGEDHAMMKRRQLIRAGLPADALKLATVTNAEGRRHSVLIVATSHGEMVLDHHTSIIVKRRDSGYSFASAEAVRFFE
ncbi:putative transglutaminase-like cysteine proteinase [Pararhizobium capsulatum DSM 1112]|uniref:Transglutaminase-like cysteine proteinase n=1 Tax=Pararhizobium capsulatum DSM 1112 TaxID=1121113 RepID=A0ABU0BN82_9HYPH|nr:transglutaminase-like cysteine peptidase [Pararhizobium capsulatum]MDQ0318905.1 putative transglutaminase-like cysteine proteinase [Pararhizobium capsulatum DSM 1112]